MPKTIRGASACLVDDSDDVCRVLVIAREKEPFGGALAFPGGHVAPDEGALEAARRELLEETGFIATGEPFAQLVIEFLGDDTQVRIESFAFLKWSAPKSSEPKAELTPIWITFADALASRLAPGMDRALIEFQRAFARIKK